jgi:hypothetical protein
VDDWVYEAEVYDIAARSGLTDPDQLRDLAIGLIAEALSRGLVVAGEYDGRSHVPWDCSTAEAIGRIAEAWVVEWGTAVPTPGAVVWLDLTTAGKEAGESVLARERTDE